MRRYRLPIPIHLLLSNNLHSSSSQTSMAAAALIFRPITSQPSIKALSSSFINNSRSNISFSTSRGLFSGGGYNYGGGDWMRRFGVGLKGKGNVCCAAQQQRGYRKVRGRPNARRKGQRAKGKELELDVRICIEEQLPDDPEILDIAELLRLNVPMAMKLGFDGLKDSDFKTRDPAIDDVGQYESVELSILLCNDELIRELNKDWRNVDHATDVLSMSQHVPELKLPMLMLGDIIISVETAARQAEERGHTLLDEIRILMVHGLLHLLGFDHELSDEAEAEMEAEEERLLKSLGWKGKGLIQSALDAEDDEIPLSKTSDGSKKSGESSILQAKVQIYLL